MADNILNFSQYNTNDFEEKVRKDRNIRIRRNAIIFIAIVSIAIIVLITFILRERSKVYESLSLQQSVILENDTGLYYDNFAGTVMAYSKDGFGARDEKGDYLWNQPFDMQNPMYSICGDTVAFADYGGSEINVQKKNGELFSINTAMPIRKIAVSNKDVVAAILEDVGVTWIYLYDSKGEVISYFRTTMEKSGYPIDIDISPSSELVMISYYYVDIGETKSSVAFYNFGDVGQNNIDNYVSGYNYKDSLVPMVRFMSDSTSFAISNSRISFYEGSQKPTSLVDNFIVTDVLSVYYDEDYVGVVTRNSSGDNAYHLTIYSNKGKVVSEKNFDFDYSKVVFGNGQYVIYGNTNIYVATIDGRTRLDYEYDRPVREVIPTNSPTKYILVTESSIDTVIMK
ncbi:MAG: DUF5711 family protein [Lachnospiraceae bacterium]|nr:DUF5711 family protein [Lachnospiraceae bacterium]